MPLSNGLVLYHGSYTEVPHPDLSKCARFKDFGQGFYLTTSHAQAVSFARLSARKAADRLVEGADGWKGFVSRFELAGAGVEDLRLLEFEGAGSDWLRCVVAHRRRGSFPNLVDRLRSYDVIAGKIANDRTNITLTLYMDGIFGEVGSAEAERACIGQLLPNRLKDQYCFRSERALECLRFMGSEVVWM
jgi:hypothetical protein